MHDTNIQFLWNLILPDPLAYNHGNRNNSLNKGPNIYFHLLIIRAHYPQDKYNNKRSKNKSFQPKLIYQKTFLENIARPNLCYIYFNGDWPNNKTQYSPYTYIIKI